ncbi:hypothetical protein [Brucella sp. LJL56]
MLHKQGRIIDPAFLSIRLPFPALATPVHLRAGGVLIKVIMRSRYGKKHLQIAAEDNKGDQRGDQ